jgi:deoxyribonuclease V
MYYKRLHSWNLSRTQAVELQKELRQQVRIEPITNPVSLVAGCDVSFNRFSDVVYAGIIILRLPDLRVVDYATAVAKTSFQYIPGLLSFRETPALLEAWQQLKTAPDVVMLDGQGIAHPRRFGIACHFGLLTDMPSIGCAKTLLVGRYEEPGQAAGSYTLLVDKGEAVGAALRTKDSAAPVFVSIGHRMNLTTAIELTLRCVKGYWADVSATLFALKPTSPRHRIPEPTRAAHILVNALRRGEPVERALKALV